MSSAPESISAYVPRGPVATAIHQLRDAVVILLIVVLAYGAGTSYFGVKVFGKVDQVQHENARLRQAAADNQRQNDARALAGQQALALLVQQVASIRTLTPEQAQAVLGAINAAIDQTTQNLKRQGVPVTPIPRITLLPPGVSSPVPSGASPRVSPPPGPMPSPSAAVNLQVQCLAICPPKRG